MPDPLINKGLAGGFEPARRKTKSPYTITIYVPGPGGFYITGFANDMLGPLLVFFSGILPSPHRITPPPPVIKSG
jgi:hypothetical protein